jgi:enoyl-CoA hydratase
VLERVGDIAHLVLDRPPRNTMDSRLFVELRRVVLDEVPRLDVIGLLVHGRGRHFSAGADVEEIIATVAEQSEAEALAALGDNQRVVQALVDCPFPVVAAIGGCCFGSALELALGCHYRIATRNALLALPEAQHGLMPGCGGTALLGSIVGAGRAMELALTGRLLDADEALEIGLVDRVVERTSLLAEAERIVCDYARAQRARPCR